jgi:hypothetical protein
LFAFATRHWRLGNQFRLKKYALEYSNTHVHQRACSAVVSVDTFDVPWPFDARYYSPPSKPHLFSMAMFLNKYFFEKYSLPILPDDDGAGGGLLALFAGLLLLSTSSGVHVDAGTVAADCFSSSNSSCDIVPTCAQEFIHTCIGRAQQLITHQCWVNTQFLVGACFYKTHAGCS